MSDIMVAILGFAIIFFLYFQSTVSLIDILSYTRFLFNILGISIVILSKVFKPLYFGTPQRSHIFSIPIVDQWKYLV